MSTTDADGRIRSWNLAPSKPRFTPPPGAVMVCVQAPALQLKLTRIASSTASRPWPLALKVCVKMLVDAGSTPALRITACRFAFTVAAAAST